MTFEEFSRSLQENTPPDTVDAVLQALWHAGSGDWDRAHRGVQAIAGADAAWVHAWLHRQEGDDWNADYWYRRAGRSRSPLSLEEEWSAIARALLDRRG